MKLHSAACITGNALAGAPLCALYTPNRRVRLLEFHATSTGTAIAIGLFRTVVRGVPTATISGEPHDDQDEASAVELNRTFSTDPGTAGASLAEFATIGQQGQEQVDWEFHNQALWVPAGNGLVLKNIALVTSQGHETFWTWEE